MRVLAFVGDDPGQKGATCLLGVLDDPDGQRHGEVVYCAVWDHSLRKTDRGEHVDPVHFAEQVRRHAIAADVPMPTTALAVPQVARVVIEVPRVGGRKFGADTVVTQGANYGIVLGASLCSSEFRAEVVDDADPAAGQWYAEAGAVCPKGKDRKQHSVETAHALLATWSADPDFLVNIPRVGPNAWGLVREDKTTDRADALLLAHLGVLRWLGRAAVPAKSGVAAAARGKAKAIRDHEVARAMEGVPRKSKVVAEIECTKCGSGIGVECSGARPCRERVWALAARHKAGAPRLGLDYAVLRHLLHETKGAAGWYISHARGVWRLWIPDGVGHDVGVRIDREALDAAIDTGLVRLTLDDKRRPVWVRRVVLG